MAWHQCSRYWKHGASCPVRGMPGHPEEEDEEDQDEESREIPKVLIPEREVKRRPPEQGSVVAVAEAIVREVQTRMVAEPVAPPMAEPIRAPVPPVLVPAWVPDVSEIVVPSLFPSPADVVGSGSTQAVAPSIDASIGDKIVEGTIAAGVGVAIGIVTVATGGAVVPWVERIVTISRILRTLSPQAGLIALPTARTLLVAAGAATVRMAAGKIPDQPPDMEREGVIIDQTMGMIEELVVDHVYPTAAERTVTISKILAGLSTSKSEDFAPKVSTPNPFGDWNDAFMSPGMYGPPPAASSATLATGAGAGGYLYDFGQYLNSQLGDLETAGGSPPPTTY